MFLSLVGTATTPSRLSRKTSLSPQLAVLLSYEWYHFPALFSPIFLLVCFDDFDILYISFKYALLFVYRF